MITEKHRELSEQLHEDKIYGATNAHRWMGYVNDLTWEYETFSVLDYGCGKGNLAKMMTKMPIHNYDPAIPEFSATPTPDDIVICTNVMECVEPEHIDDVIQDLKRVTNIALVVNIALAPARETLADGRNANLTVEDIEFWQDKFLKYFDLSQINGINGREVTMVLFKRVEH